MKKARKRCNRQLHRASVRLDGEVCQAEGAGCDLQEERQRREISALCDELIHPFSFSGQVSANLLSPFLAGKREPRMPVKIKQMKYSMCTTRKLWAHFKSQQ